MLELVIPRCWFFLSTPFAFYKEMRLLDQSDIELVLIIAFCLLLPLVKNLQSLLMHCTVACSP